MNWRKLDLNLLVVFHAVMQERSATGAAAKLNMTQPAVSHALTRLRGALKDDLFIRTPEGMEPTPYASRLAEPIRHALDELGAALDGAAEFEPATAERTFKVALNNHASLVIAAPLAAAITAEAPGVTLDMRPSGTLNITEQLDRGELDCAIGRLASPGERFSDLRLFADGFSVILRRGHPIIHSDSGLTLEELARVPHLVVSSTGEDTGFVDTMLARSGLARQTALRAPLLATAPILAQSDMIAVITTRAAREFARTAPLLVLDLPFASPHQTTALLWHRRLDHVPAHRWLRSLVCRVTNTI
jgi:DNA-binding transcriptional LysR family regulator